MSSFMIYNGGRNALFIPREVKYNVEDEKIIGRHTRYEIV